MVLRTTISVLLFACCFVLSPSAMAWGDDAKPAVKLEVPPAATPAKLPDGWLNRSKAAVADGAAVTLGLDSGKSKLTPAVHVNGSGINSLGAGEQANGVANRLRSARESVNLGKDKSKDAPLVGKADEAIREFLGTSRRRKPAPAKTAAATKVTPRGTTPSESAAQLLSVMKRGQGTPTIAEPTLAAPKSAAPVLAGPQLAPKLVDAVPAAKASLQASSRVPQLAAPQKARSVTISQPAQKRVATLPQTITTRPESAPIRIDNTVPYGNITLTPLNGSNPGSQSGVTQPAPVRNQAVASNGRQNGVRQSAQPVPPTAGRAVGRTTGKTPLRDHEEHDGNVLLSNRSPVLVVKTHGQKTIRVGRAATYYVTATNAGDLSAEDVVVSVNVPKWAELTNHQASAGVVKIQPNTTGDNVMKWQISDLKPETRQRLRIDLIPRNSRPIDLAVNWNFKSVSATAQIQVQEPKLQLSVVGPSDIRYGETKLYTITISNPGTGDADNVMLTLLPLNEGAGSKSREIGKIKAGTRRVIEVELTARQAGELAVRALASADSGLKTSGKQEVRVRRPQLTIKAGGPAKKYAGTNARYAIKVSNTGDAIAQNVVATASLPMAGKYVDSTSGGVFDANKSTVTWTIGSLRPGAHKYVELTATLMGAGSNRLDVRTSGADELAAMDAATTQVESEADLKLIVDDPKGSIEVGAEMSYELRIVNRGTREARNVNVVGYFSEGIEPVGVRGWRADVEVGQVILETIPRIAPKQEILVTVTAKASRAGHHVFRTELASTDPETKLAVEEWTNFHGDSVAPSILDEGVTKEANADEFEFDRR